MLEALKWAYLLPRINKGLDLIRETQHGAMIQVDLDTQCWKSMGGNQEWG